MYTLDKTKIIVPAGHTESVARAIFALKEGVFTKIICGAANTNEKHVERLALVYALSGVNVIDVAPSQIIIQAAKTGIKKASELYNQNPEAFSHFKEPVLMVSIDAGDDLHFRKAEIDYKKCTNCLECINSCPQKALYSDNSVQLNKNNCVGCGRCSEACLQNAISLAKFNNSLCHCEQSREPNFLTKCQKRRGTIQKSAHGEWIATSHPTDAPRNDEQAFKAIEIHTGNNSIEEVKSFLELNASLLKNIELLSFCVESKRFNPAELQNYANSLTKLVNKKVIIQIDGIPMGATDKPCSSLQTVSAAAILLENKLDAYIQLSGGTNHLTKKLVSQLGLKISGIGYGTFARKLILSYLDELEENFFAQLQRIVNITTSLVDN